MFVCFPSPRRVLPAPRRLGYHWRVVQHSIMATPQRVRFVLVRYQSNTFSIAISDPDTSIAELKLLLAAHPDIGVPVEEQQLIASGVLLSDDQLVSECRHHTTMQLIRRRIENTSSPASPSRATAMRWVRPPYEPLPLVTHELPYIAGDLFATAKFFVWCTARTASCFPRLDDEEEHHWPRCATEAECLALSRHVSIGADSEGVPYPHELQRASARARCNRCKSERVLVDLRDIQWDQLFSTSLHGECYHCESYGPIIEIAFVCRGVLARDVEFDRSIPPRPVCRSYSTSGRTVPLPHVRLSSVAVESADTGSHDMVQLEFHGCTGPHVPHVINANGLDRYLASQWHIRSMMVRNGSLPEHLGPYAIQCFSPGCSGILYLPTWRIAGSERYHMICEWAATESLLEQGGVLCPLPNHLGCPAYAPPADEPGPRRYCPSCKDYFCEEHRQPWRSCLHNFDIDGMVRWRITDILSIGSAQPCPKCRVWGQRAVGLCTSQICSLCNSTWCYFCGQSVTNMQEHNINWETNATRCPRFLDEHPRLTGTLRIESLARFHHLKTLRLLRDIRQAIEEEAPGRFDVVFRTFPQSLLSTEVHADALESGAIETATMPPITLEMIQQPREEMLPYAMP